MNWPQVNTTTFKMSKLHWKNRVLKIYSLWCNSPQLVYAAMHRQWYYLIKYVPCLHPFEWSFYMDPNVSNAHSLKAFVLALWIDPVLVVFWAEYTNFKAMRSCTSNPLSARYLSPGSKRLQKSLFSNNFSVTYVARIKVADKSHPIVGSDSNCEICSQSTFQNVFDSPLVCHA